MRKIPNLTKSSDGIVSRYINRKVSIHITHFLLWIYPNIAPTTVSVFCFVLGLIGGTFIFFSFPLIGGIIIQLSSIIDGCDGEIARLKNKSSKTGALLDSVFDRYADGFILVMIIYYLQIHWTFPNTITLLFVVGLLAIIGSFMISYTATKSAKLLPHEFSRTIEGRDFRYFVLMLGGIAAFFWYFALFLAILYIACVTNLKVIQRVYFLNKSISSE